MNLDAELVFFLALLAGILVVIRMLMIGPRSQSPFRYRLATHQLSESERSFFSVLAQAAAKDHLVLAKVRVADVLSRGNWLRRSKWQRAFNAIAARHFDFLLCDPSDCSIRMAIAFDDAGRGSAGGQGPDELVEQACSSALLPLLRVRAAHSYSASELRDRIQALLTPRL